MSILFLPFLITAAWLACSISSGASHKRGRPVSATPGDFNYYLLSMSWAPDFCAQTGVQKSERECGAGRHVGFVIHGLWPQVDSGRSPQECAPARPVGSEIVNSMLPLMPSEGLIQHEWREHGTCSGTSASEYFANVRKAFNSVKVPREYAGLSHPIQANPSEIESRFAAANPAFPRAAFRVSCKNNELEEVRVCFSKTLEARACTASAGECRASAITMRPLR